MKIQLLSDLVQPLDLPCLTTPIIEEFVTSHQALETTAKQNALLHLLQDIDDHLIDNQRIQAINTIQSLAYVFGVSSLFEDILIPKDDIVLEAVA